jgi:hypothetical protein
MKIKTHNRPLPHKWAELSSTNFWISDIHEERIGSRREKADINIENCEQNNDPVSTGLAKEYVKARRVQMTDTNNIRKIVTLCRQPSLPARSPPTHAPASKLLTE